MGLFKGLFGKKEIILGSPVCGRCVSLSEVGDPTFREGYMGEGVAFLPKDGKVFAPVDGTVTTAFPTGHAVAITTADGIEVLIHIGMDTVKLKGDGFRLKVETGQKVKKGDLLVEADLKEIAAAGYDLVTPMVVCNSSDFARVEGKPDKEVAVGDDVIAIEK
ncbi:MAG: PTS glucose transporter subunit IIA [Lachnospiraceae bacterium]|nr:PTS glucose transporter subunit IIA [Lachnospiraceae bacterium]